MLLTEIWLHLYEEKIANWQLANLHTLAESLVNISPKELEVKFGFAKKEICRIIFNELEEKRAELNVKILNLNNYLGNEGIIPTEFKGEVINVTEEEKQDKPQKQEFDM